jgi:hypothetical protein
MEIRADRVFEAFDATLELVDSDEQERLRRILAASRDAVERSVHDVVREVVDEINAAAAGAVRASLVYGPDGLEVRVETPGPGVAPEPPPDVELDFDASEIERLTLRLPAELKEIATMCADQAGVSLNAWLTRVVSREAGRSQHRSGGGRHPGGAGQSLRGWIDG